MEPSGAPPPTQAKTILQGFQQEAWFLNQGVTTTFKISMPEFDPQE
jgi:hypothetical protein